MSRIGKQIIPVPNGVEVSFSTLDVQTRIIEVKGPHGTLSTPVPKVIKFNVVNGNEVYKQYNSFSSRFIEISLNSISKLATAQYGLIRSLVSNMVRGVSSPFIKSLRLQGVGYRAQVNGNILKLSLGCSHDIFFDIPDDIKVKVDGNTVLEIIGIDKIKVGMFAAQIRNKRPPEPYNGKGVLYLGENIRRKAGKVGK